MKGKISVKQDTAEKISWYQCFGSIPPAPSVTEWPGQWRAKKDCKPEMKIIFNLFEDQVLSPEAGSDESWHRLAFDPNAGLTCGEMLSFGAPDLPGDQRFFNRPDHTWTSSILDNNLDIFGFPEFSCTFRVIDDSQGQLVAKLCDVFPDGSSRLISFGVANLNHFRSSENPEMIMPGKR